MNLNLSIPNTFHLFAFEDKDLLFEANSMQIFEINHVDADIIENKKVNTDLLKKYGKNQIYDSIKRINGLCKMSHVYRINRKLNRNETKQKFSTFWLNISHACNLNCNYCFAKSRRNGNRDESMESDKVESFVDSILNQKKMAANCRIIFFGGEPLTNWEFLKRFVRVAEKKAKKQKLKLNFYLITNGTLLNEKISNFLKKHEVSVQISLDGPNKVHDKLRPLLNGKGSYNKVIRGIKILKKCGIDDIAVRATLTHFNCDIIMLSRFFKRMGFNRVQIVPVQANNDSECYLTPEDILLIQKSYSSLAKGIIESIKKGRTTDLGLFSDYFMQIHERQKKEYFCGSGFESVSIDTNGKLHTCHRLISDKVFEMGHISGNISTRKKLAAQSVDEKPYCSRCWCKYFCGGGCLAAAFTICKSLYKPDNKVCEITRCIVEEVLRIYFVAKSLKKEIVAAA